MSRLAIPSRDEAPEITKPLLDAIGGKLGIVPNMFRLIASSPAALEGTVGLVRGLRDALDLETRTRIAVAVAAVNGSDYCMSAQTFLGANVVKLDAAELDANRHGRSGDVRADAAVRFAKVVAETRGKVSDAELQAVRSAGFADSEIVEIVTVVAESFLTNLINNVAETDIDFPFVPTKAVDWNRDVTQLAPRTRVTNRPTTRGTSQH